MRLALLTVATGAVFGLTAAASADAIVTLPFTLTAGAGQTATATSTLALDPASEYTYTFVIESVTVHAAIFGTPANFNPMDFGDITAPELAAAGSVTTLPSMAFTGHYDSVGSAYPTGFNFDVDYELLADGRLQASLTGNSFGAYRSTLTIAHSVTVTGTAIAEVVPVPAPAAAAGFLGLGGLALRRRR